MLGVPLNAMHVSITNQPMQSSTDGRFRDISSLITQPVENLSILNRAITENYTNEQQADNDLSKVRSLRCPKLSSIMALDEQAIATWIHRMMPQLADGGSQVWHNRSIGGLGFCPPTYPTELQSLLARGDLTFGQFAFLENGNQQLLRTKPFAWRITMQYNHGDYQLRRKLCQRTT